MMVEVRVSANEIEFGLQGVSPVSGHTCRYDCRILIRYAAFPAEG